MVFSQALGTNEEVYYDSKSQELLSRACSLLMPHASTGINPTDRVFTLLLERAAYPGPEKEQILGLRDENAVTLLDAIQMVCRILLALRPSRASILIWLFHSGSTNTLAIDSVVRSSIYSSSSPRLASSCQAPCALAEFASSIATLCDMAALPTYTLQSTAVSE
jgi:hypothetical protein